MLLPLSVPRFSRRLPALFAACLVAAAGLRCGGEEKAAPDPMACKNKCYYEDLPPCEKACADEYAAASQTCETNTRVCQVGCDVDEAACNARGWYSCGEQGLRCKYCCTFSECNETEAQRARCDWRCSEDLHNCYDVCDPAGADSTEAEEPVPDEVPGICSVDTSFDPNASD